MLKARSYTVGKTKHMANKKLHSWQNKTCCKQEVTRLLKQNRWQTRSYTVGKTKHAIIEMVHGWQNKICCKQEVTRLAK